MGELSPCPFCGDADVVIQYDHNDAEWYAQCQSRASECPFVVINSAATSREEAIAAWNKRARLSAPRAALSPEDAACLTNLTRLVWSLGQWNDHNWTHGDYAKWRDAARKEALAAADVIDRLSGRSAGEETNG